MEEKKENVEYEKFDPKLINFNIDASDNNYQIDVLQNRLLEGYIRADPRFRRAFHTNYTMDFLQYIKDKAKLREPIHISTVGVVRGGKSYSMISVAIIIMALQGKKFTIEYICGDEYEFIQKLQEMPQEKLFNTCFLIDEKKSTVYGVGSTAKKMKAKDVQNIIAINNISTISLTPMKFSNPDAQYGLRAFGRNFNNKTVRLMLYNLQGSKAEIPMGCIYLPIFTKESFIPKEYAEQLEKDYLQKKNEWVMAEQTGTGDVLGEIKKKSAMNFLNDNQFMELKKKNEKLVYITQKMGSEWTKGEIEEIFYLTKMMENGIDLDFREEKE